MFQLSKRAGLVSAALLAWSCMAAQDTHDCEFSAGGVDYSITREWTHDNLEELFEPYLADDPAAFMAVSDFFVYDGNIYFDAQYDFFRDTNSTYGSRDFVMYRYRPDAHELDKFKVEVPDAVGSRLTLFPCDYFFVGKDSDGTPYIIPHEGSYARQVAFHTQSAVFPLEIKSDGTPVLCSPFIFEGAQREGDIIEEPVIDGSLATGNFTVAYYNKKTNYYTEENCDKWNEFVTVRFTDGTPSGPERWESEYFAKPCIQVVAPGEYLTSDRSYWFNGQLVKQFTCFISVKSPILYESTGEGHLIESQGSQYVYEIFDNPGLMAGGASYFKVGDLDFLFYVTGIANDESIEDMYFEDWGVKRHTYTFATVKGYDMSVPEKKHSYSGDEFGYYTSTGNLYVDRSHPQAVNDGAELYTLTGHKALSKFKVSAGGVSSLDVPVAVDSEVEYFTPDGRRCPSASAPGIYIRKAGTEIKKIIVR